MFISRRLLTQLLAAAALLSAAIVPAHAKIDFDNLQWETQIDRDNLKVMTATVPEQSIKAFRGISTYNTTIPQLVATITDMENFTNWVAGAKKAEVVKRLGAKSQAAYYVNDFPFPAKDRDWVFVQRIETISEEKVKIHVGIANDLVPETDDYTRVDQAQGTWILEKTGPDQVQLTYEMHVDPAGTLPTWMVNMMLTNSPKDTLKQLHDVDFSRYQAIEEPKLHLTAKE